MDTCVLYLRRIKVHLNSLHMILSAVPIVGSRGGVVASKHSDQQPVCEIHLDHQQKSSYKSDLSESQQNHSSISSRKNKGGKAIRIYQ